MVLVCSTTALAALGTLTWIDSQDFNGTLTKNSGFNYSKKFLSDKKIDHFIAAYNHFYAISATTLYVLDEKGQNIKTLSLPANTVDLTSGDNKVFIALTNGKAVTIDNTSNNLLPGDIDLQTSGGFQISRIFYYPGGNQLVVAYSLNGTGAYGALINTDGTLVRRLNLYSSYNNYKFDYDSSRNLLVCATPYIRRMANLSTGAVYKPGSSVNNWLVYDIVFSKSSKYLYVFTRSRSNTVGYTRYDTTNGTFGSTYSYSSWTNGNGFGDIVANPQSNKFYGSYRPYSGSPYVVEFSEPSGRPSFTSIGCLGANNLSFDAETKRLAANDLGYGLWVAGGNQFSGTGYGPSSSVLLYGKTSDDRIAKWSNLIFNKTLPEDTNTYFRIKTASKQQDLSLASYSQWYQVDTAEAYFYLSNIIANGTWIQIEVNLTSLGFDTPELKSVSVDYESVIASATSCSLSTDCHESTYPKDNFDEAQEVKPIVMDRCAKCHKSMYGFSSLRFDGSSGAHLGIHDFAIAKPLNGFFGGFAGSTFSNVHLRHTGIIPNCTNSGCHDMHGDSSGCATYSDCHDVSGQSLCGSCHRPLSCSDCHDQVIHEKHNNPNQAANCSDSNCHGSLASLNAAPACTNCHYRDNENRVDAFIDKSGHGDINTKHQVKDEICASCHSSQIDTYHLERSDSSGNQMTCATCHKSSRPEVILAIRQNDTTCIRCHPNSGHNFLPPGDVPLYKNDGYLWTAPIKASQYNGESWMPDSFLDGGYVIFTNHQHSDGNALYNWYLDKLADNGWAEVSSDKTRPNYWSLTYQKEARKITVNFYDTTHHNPEAELVSTGPRIEIIYLK